MLSHAVNLFQEKMSQIVVISVATNRMKLFVAARTSVHCCYERSTRSKIVASSTVLRLFINLTSTIERI